MTTPMETYLHENLCAQTIAETAVFGTPPESPAATVVIVTYNPPVKLFRRCLRSLREQSTRDRFEIVLIDNHSTAPIREIAGRLDLRYIRLKENYGLSLARNVGVMQAAGTVIIFLDDDAIPAGNFIAAHLEAHAEKKIHGLRGKCIPRTSSVYNYLQNHYDLGDQQIPSYIDLEGNSSFARDILIEIGGFNPELKGAGGGEGTELSYRLITRYGDRSKLIYCPTAVIYHDFCSGCLRYFRKILRHAGYRKIRKQRFPGIFEFVESYRRSSDYPPPPGAIGRFRLKVIRKLARFLLSRGKNQ